MNHFDNAPRVLALCLVFFLGFAPPLRAQSDAQKREAKVMQDAAWLRNALNTFWVGELKRLYNIDFEPVVRLHYYRGDGVAPCGGLQQPMPKNAFFCGASRDEHIAFDSDWFENFLVRWPGGATTFLILAHEWGHAVQHAWLKNNGGDVWNPAYRKELNADCLAGAFLAWAYRNGHIKEDSDDADALWNWLYSSGSPWLDPKTHGSHEQRVTAFQDGMTTGIHDCRVRY